MLRIKPIETDLKRLPKALKAGKLPRPLKVTPQVTAWRFSAIQEWAEDPAGYIADGQGGR